MSKASSYKNTESIAIWNIPENRDKFNTLSDKGKDIEFKRVYKPNYFTHLTKLKRVYKSRYFNLDNIQYRKMDHVIVGIQLGNSLYNIPAGTLRAFHNDIKNKDYRLASALLDTEYWGSFMTILSVRKNKKSNKIALNNQHVDALLDEFKDVGVSPNAKVLLLGEKVFKSINEYTGNKAKGYSASKELEEGRVCKINGYTFKKIYHYSSLNMHWNRSKVINQINN